MDVRKHGLVLGSIGILLVVVAGVFLFRNSYLNGEPKPGLCLVLEEKYCSSGTVVYAENGYPAVAFNLPQGTPIFAPYEGEGFEGQSPKSGYYAVVVLGDNRQGSFWFVGADEAPDMEGVQIESGVIIGYIADGLFNTPSVLIADEGEYNLLITLTKDGEADTGLYKELFGNINL